MNSLKKRVLSIIVALAVLVGNLYAVPIANAEEAQVQGNTTGNIVYAENFDEYTGDNATTLMPVALDSKLSSGESVDYETGWIVKSNQTAKSSVELKNGAMYVNRTSGSYDLIYRDGGQTWGNYTYEADITYKADSENWNTSSAPWFRLAFNIQENTDGTTKLMSSAIVPGTKSDYRGTYSFANTTAWPIQPNKTDIKPDNKLGETYRHRIVVENNTVTSYYALYENNELGNWIEAYKYESIPEDMQTGSVGFVFGGGYGTFKIDNISVIETNPIVFKEDFSSYSGTIDITTDTDADYGLNFIQKSTSTTAKIEDGKLWLVGANNKSAYDQIYFAAGKNWTNYTVEADYCQTKTGGWGGLLFRSAEDGKNFWKAGFSLDDNTDGNNSASVSLNGMRNGSWYKNHKYSNPIVWENDAACRDQNWGEQVISNYARKSTDTHIYAGDVIRMKVVVDENKASLYMANYDVNGNLNPYEHALTISDKFATEHMSGTIGLMLSNGGSASCWIDNIVVTRGDDRIVTDPNRQDVADIYVPETGIVNPPVVVQRVTNSLPSIEEECPAVAMMDIDANLNILNTAGQSIASIDDYFAGYNTKIIPAFVVDSEAEAEAIARYLKINKFVDAYLMATEENVAFVKKARTIWENCRGGLIFDSLGDTEEEWAAACRLANDDNLVTQLISKEPLSIEAVTYFNVHAIAAWSYADDITNVYNAISAGYHSVVTEDPSLVYGVYKSITETTVSGKPIIIGHRGGDTIEPENTLEAFQEAMNYGCMAVETDLRLTSDGYIVLFHDAWLSDVTDIVSNSVYKDGNSYVNHYTLAELKQLNVHDHKAGKARKIPTFEEALEAFEDTGLVFYAHINDINTFDEFNRIFTEHPEYVDNVVVFYKATGVEYAYNWDSITVPVPFTVSHADGVDDILAQQDDLDVIEGFIGFMNKWNANPLFKDYYNHINEAFYYKMASRGFLSIHTITDDTQQVLDERLLVGQGAVSKLIDHIDRTDEYHYFVDVADESVTLKIGTAIDLTHDLKKVSEIERGVSCDFVQLSGPNLIYSEGCNGYTISEEGQVVLVYYTTQTAEGSATYRVYSKPVTIQFTIDGIDESDNSIIPDNSKSYTYAVLDSIDQADDGADRITEGYSENNTYVVLSARLKALNPVAHDWSSNVCIGVSGTDYWNNYAFQILYGTANNQNLIKLNGDEANPMGGGSFDGVEVGLEQWYNNSKLEQLFEDDGIDIKVVRFSTWTYLLVDMRDGYELIGKMVLPENAPTQLSLYNNKTEVRMSKITVETGKNAVLSAIEGCNIDVKSNDYYFPMDSANWTIEGKLAITLNENLWSNDYSVFAGTNQNKYCASILFSQAENCWKGQENAGEANQVFSDTYSNMLIGDGLWVRWVRQGNTLSLWASTDKTTWMHVIDNLSLRNGAYGLYIMSNRDCDATLKNIRISTEGEMPESFEQSKGAMTFVPGNYSDAKYAVLDINLKSLEEKAYGWSQNVVLSASGTKTWDAYDFQLLYGSAENQLVKLTTGDGTYDGISVAQEQWVYNAGFENIFSENGLKLKLVRMRTWAYLLADMGNGYEIIGRTYIPEDQPTQFAIYNQNRGLHVSDWSVQVGKEDTLAALDGMDIDMSATTYSFPVDSVNWTIEGKLSMNTSLLDLTLGDHRVYVGTTVWSNCTSILRNANNWYGQEHDTWANNTISEEYYKLLDTNGLWVRWTREGKKLSLWISKDRVDWTWVLDNGNLDDVARGVYLTVANDSASPSFSDVSIRTSVGEDTYNDMSSDSIAITSLPNKTSYFAGDVFDTTGMVVVLKKGNEVVRTVSLDDCTISPKKELTVTDEKVTVSYRGFSVDVPITVVERKITEVRLKDLPYWTEYNQGDTVNVSGATYLATYDNGDLIEYSIEKDMCNAVDTTESGNKTVTATVPYNNGTSELTFTVYVKGDSVACELVTREYTANQASKYLAGENTYPELEGYVFAGWYTTNNIPTDTEAALKYVIRNSVPDSAVTVYALFVPEHVLSVKAQVSAHLMDDDVTEDDKKASIRFVTTVDSLLYQQVGFEISYIGSDGTTKTVKSETKKVYERLYVTGSNSKKIWEETPDSFCAVSEYFRACTINNVPETHYQTKFTVRPYWITLGGDKVYGVSAEKTIEEGSIREAAYYSESGQDIPYYGSSNHPYKTKEYALAHVKDASKVYKIDSVTMNTSMLVMQGNMELQGWRRKNEKFYS